MKLLRFGSLFLILLVLLVLQSCTALKPYEKVYVNDPEMQMGGDSSESYNKYVQSIREGGIPAGGSKGSGGCGCN